MEYPLQSNPTKYLMMSKLVQEPYALIGNARLEDRLVAVFQLRDVFEKRVALEDDGNGVCEYPINQTHYLTQQLHQYFVGKNLHQQPQIALCVIDEIKEIVMHQSSLEDS